MDDAVGVPGCFFEPVEILEVAATHRRAERGQGRRGRLRPGQAGDLVAGRDEFRDDVRTGVTGSASDENAHVALLLMVVGAGCDQLTKLTPREKLVRFTE